jgi:glutamine synthetase
MDKVTEIFASEVFNDSVMKERLPQDIYEQLQRTVKNGRHLDLSLATVTSK